MATVQYPVVLDANRSTIILDPESTISDDIVEHTIDLGYNDIRGPSIFGGFAFALNNRYGSIGHLAFAGAIVTRYFSTGSVAPQYVTPDSIGSGNDCNPRYSNPLPDLTEHAREFMFRTAIAWGNSTTVQSFPASQVKDRLVYESRYLFLGLSVLSSSLAMIAVTSIFHGYWHLGRKMTMSPLEIAKAFNAPILGDQDSNAKASDLVKSAGDRAVRFGAVSVIAKVDDSDDASERPGHLMRWDSAPLSTMRLEMADAAAARVPEKGSTFVPRSMQSFNEHSMVERVDTLSYDAGG